MKRMLSALFCVTLLLALAACGAQDKPTEPDPVEKPSFTADTFPKVDGSTATIPLSEGMVKALLSYSADEAQDFVHHNTTHNAYLNLLQDKCEIIFVTSPSEEEQSLLEDSPNDYEVQMVVKDAFVFLVNSQNPIENISVEDLQKIYKGEITNWSQLGGSDEEIVAFQRPDNSGSQTLMYKLLVPKSDIADAPTELRPAGMGDLVDAVSDYDEGLNSIGYSVYYYASGMYTDQNSKLISVGGVFPTPETIADGSYPLTDGYYAVYNKDLPEESGVRQLINWLTSDEGQKMAADEGYVPLRVIEG